MPGDQTQYEADGRAFIIYQGVKVYVPQSDLKPGPPGPNGEPGVITKPPPALSEPQRKGFLGEQAGLAGQFAGVGEAGYGQMTAESAAQRDYMGKVARGEISLSGEQLRQGLQQNVAAQRSMSAGAAPQNAAMAARTAAMQSARLGSGMAGQAATAGLQERDAAQKRLAEMISMQRGQDMQVALGSRQNSMTGYGAGSTGAPPAPGKSAWDYGLQAASIVGPLLASDERLKTSIKDGDAKAKATMEGLRAYSYKYKNDKYGKGEQLGVMAQDLEKAGLGQAVVNQPDGKKVDSAKLAGALAAMVATQHRRISKLEKGSK